LKLNFIKIQDFPNLEIIHSLLLLNFSLPISEGGVCHSDALSVRLVTCSRLVATRAARAIIAKCISIGIRSYKPAIKQRSDRKERRPFARLYSLNKLFDYTGNARARRGLRLARYMLVTRFERPPNTDCDTVSIDARHFVNSDMLDKVWDAGCIYESGPASKLDPLSRLEYLKACIDKQLAWSSSPDVVFTDHLRIALSSRLKSNFAIVTLLPHQLGAGINEYDSLDILTSFETFCRLSDRFYGVNKLSEARLLSCVYSSGNTSSIPDGNHVVSRADIISILEGRSLDVDDTKNWMSGNSTSVATGNLLLEEGRRLIQHLNDYNYQVSSNVIASKIAAALVAGGFNRTTGGFNRTSIGRKAKTTGGNIGKSLAKAVFWVLWLIFILMGLSQFPALSDQLGFLNGMMENIFSYLPQLAIGGFVLAVGILLSRVVKEALTSTLEVAQVDNLVSRFGITGDAEDGVPNTSLSKSAGVLAAAVVTITAAATAIGIWDIPGVSGPVAGLLDKILDYIPNIIGAAIILAIFIFIGRFVSNLAKSTLPGLGVDNSLSSLASLDGETSNFVPSNVIANVSFIGIALMGLTAAMNTLGVPELTNVFNTLLEIGGRVVLGAVIIGAGLFIANFVSKIVTQTSGDLAGKIIKYATMIIVTFMGLETMQLGEGIVDTAFRYSVIPNTRKK